VADLTPAERRALDEELAALRRRTVRRILILLCVLAVPAYVVAAADLRALQVKSGRRPGCTPPGCTRRGAPVDRDHGRGLTL
jgi:hypothetical protein